MINSISLRFGLWFAMFGILASVVTATVSYHESRELLAESAERELATTTHILSREFNHSINEIAKDVLFLASIPQTAGYFQSSNKPLLAKQLTDIFKQKLRLNNSYFQLRFIGADNFGQELIRVDRLSDGLIAIEAEQLEEKAHYPYVFRTLRLGDGDSYLSDVDIHNEKGVELGQHQPTLKVASPVFSGGKALGLVVVNVGLENLFSLLQADLPSGVEIYLANQKGDYLVNPNPDKQFGFHYGHRYLMQRDFPQMEALFSDFQPRTFVLDPSAAIRYERAVSFTPLFYGPASSQKLAVLALVSPLPTLSNIIDSLAGSMIKVCLALSLLGLLTSLLFAKVLSQPIRNMVVAVKAFSTGNLPAKRLLPSQRKDEIGLLATTFGAMSQQINKQIEELKRNEVNLRHMASHDSLTGLPNRGLFLEQLKISINRAQRKQSGLAVVFIDLDNFKQVNDNLGHEAGDHLLQEVAKVLRDVVRAEDAVARFAGDEFMLALESIDEDEASEVVATVLRRLAQEVSLGVHIQPVYASVGISLYPANGTDPEMLIRNADAAMYKAKSSGRNQYSYFDLDLIG
ncbi:MULTISPECIES: putative bifunctional diguanylate cyclase/phosphodiesterase [unclassified Agarivorans]|nr:MULTISPECIES: GGDEF domain-containing protein [unclassified Agarivorans]MDO6686629.1 GGDEF domain-containing protein [Agarivorans sp. 3_MG-2023]MDO6715447.1 GGDEF domain-containing protein [Agarivorans sp. 2_MG-2023]MDO6763236.1 GGDEF domain-containing protein [Agarivorans sp. 1_MG-2023]